MGVHDENRIRATKSDLRSLGIEPKSNANAEELYELADAIKQSMYEEYKLAYSNEGEKYEAEAKATLTSFSQQVYQARVMIDGLDTHILASDSIIVSGRAF